VPALPLCGAATAYARARPRRRRRSRSRRDGDSGASIVEEETRTVDRWRRRARRTSRLFYSARAEAERDYSNLSHALAVPFPRLYVNTRKGLLTTEMGREEGAHASKLRLCLVQRRARPLRDCRGAASLLRRL